MKKAVHSSGEWRAKRGTPLRGRGTSHASFEGALARFAALYESRDGKLLLFEDEQGHLQAVDAKRLA